MGTPRMVWGGWELQPDGSTLVLKHDGEWKYEIRLNECEDSAGVLDWIFQVHKKPWLTNQEMRDLLNAIDDVIDPQGNLCSGGASNTIDIDKHLAGYLKSDPERIRKLLRELDKK